jgi:hypothetical protein
MITRSDSGATRCCKCECHCCREPKWACSLCGRGFTRKFNVLRHLDTKHEGLGAPIPYDEYRTGKSSGEVAEVTVHGDGPKSLSRVSPKSRQILTLLNKRTQETVGLIYGIRFKNIGNNIIISARVCKSCISLALDGYIIMENGNQTPLPSHLCRCEWLLDHPNIDSRSDLVERYLNERIGSSLAEVIRPYPLSLIPPCIEFSRLDDLWKVRIDYDVTEKMVQLEKNEEKRNTYKIIFDTFREKAEAIMDDIKRNYIPLDSRQYWWCSGINGTEGYIYVSREDALTFLQFFKSNSVKIRLKFSNGEAYYSLTIK